MVVHGHVQGGVVVLDGAPILPEGSKVTVLVGPAEVGTICGASRGGHSILDIPPVSLGAVLRTMTSEDDLLGEMLEGRI
jgi:hypothetical protein